MFDPPPRPAPAILSRLWVQITLTTLAAILAHATFIGSSGLSQSEGHRAIPGWTMMKTGEWIVPHLFEQPYLRKPPGMPWAVAGMSEIFGVNEWSARMVSAFACIGMAIVALAFTRRWFGPRFALAAGLAQALTPLFYLHPSGRSAEIEPLHNFFAQVVTLIVFDSIIRPGSRTRARMLGIVGGFALGAMFLTKGPAAVPCVLAAVGAGLWARWRPKALLTPTLAIGVPLGLGIAGIYAYVLARAVNALPLMPVVESPTEFLFREGTLNKVLALIPVALASAVPLSLTLIVLALPMPRPDYLVEQRRRAKALALACLLSLGIYVAFGVSNNRYAMPALGLLAPLAAFWLADAHIRLTVASARRVRVVAACILVVLIGLTVPYAKWSEARRLRNTGENVAGALAAILPDGAQVWADQVIEQRPEILWYTQQRAQALGKTIRPRWMPHRAGMPPNVPEYAAEYVRIGAGVGVGVGVGVGEGADLDARAELVYLLVRTDARDDSGELALVSGSRSMQGVAPIWEGKVQNLELALFKVGGDALR